MRLERVVLNNSIVQQSLVVGLPLRAPDRFTQQIIDRPFYLQFQPVLLWTYLFGDHGMVRRKLVLLLS